MSKKITNDGLTRSGRGQDAF